MITLNEQIENISFKTTKDDLLSFLDLRGKNVILYFYPKDSTPGCTIEGGNFRDSYAKFNKLNTIIFGVSRDSLASHERFKSKRNFPFELISDESENLCKYFDVIKQKSLFGKKYMLLERSTFLIDEKGILRAEWRKIKIKGHVASVLEEVRKL